MTEWEIFGPDLDGKPLDIGDALLGFLGSLGASTLLNERNLAMALRYIASASLNEIPFDEVDLADFWLSVADAIDHPKAKTLLRLGYAKRGQPESNTDRYRCEGRDSAVAFDVFDDFSRHGQLEAAIAKVARANGLSRSTVFRTIRRAAVLDVERRTNNDGTVLYSDDAESRQFENWLDR